MAKMFYTLEEAAARLGKPAEEVTKMAASGQIQEFRDRDKLMFKKEQIDLLAGDDETEQIGLADSADNKAIEDKEESVLGLMDSKESTGISIFDSDDLEKADPSAATQVSDSISPAGFSLDPHASGSGLLDLTREADDTSLGAVLDDINYPGDEEGAAQSGGASGLFASPGGEVAAVAGGAMVMPSTVEYYDGAGSGLTIGLAIGALVSLMISTLVVFTALVGDQTVAGIAVSIAGNLWMYVGIFAGVTILAGIIGWFVGKTFQ